jgi:hypothetical protein
MLKLKKLVHLILWNNEFVNLLKELLIHMDTKQLCNDLVIWLKSAVKNANARGTVLGISGGIDSAVAGMLCKIAFPENTLGHP